MTRANEADLGSLIAIKGEIDLALSRTAEALADKKLDETKKVQIAQTHLHQVYGALSIVGLDGVTQFTAAIDLLLGAIAKQSLKLDEALHSLILRSLSGITNYLDELVHGAPDQPLRLFTLYAELLAVQGQKASPTDLFFPDLSIRLIRRELPQSEDELTQELRTVRARFEHSLLGFLRDRNDLARIKALRARAGEIEKLQTAPLPRSLWWSTMAFFDAASRGSVPPDDCLRLSLQLDTQLRRSLTGNITVPERLLREILFFVAAAPVKTKVQKAVRETWALDALIPAPGSDVSQIPLAPLEEALYTPLTAAGETWGLFSSGQVSALKEFKNGLAKIDGPLQRIGRPTASRLLAGILRFADWLEKDPARINETIGMEVASAMLLLEAAIDRTVPDTEFSEQVGQMLQSLTALAKGKSLPAQQEVPGLALTRRGQEKGAVIQLSKEILNNLFTIEQTLDDFFRDQEKREPLNLLPPLIQQIQGALTLLGENQAIDLTKKARRTVQKLIDGSVPEAQDELENLAHDLSALGFYVESLQHNRLNLQRLLNPDAVPELPQEPPVEYVEGEAEASEVSPDEVVLEDIQQFGRDTEIFQLPPLESDEELLPEPAPARTESAEDMPEPTEETRKLIQASDEEVDQELLNIFIEEAHDVLENISGQLVVSRNNPVDMEALTSIRRGFHTLKGSGRMVGLRDMGEAAWGVEQTLNRWLQLDQHPTPELHAMLDQAQTLFTQWIAQMEAGGSHASPDPQAEARLLATASQLRSADDDEVETASSEASSPEQAAPSEQTQSPEEIPAKTKAEVENESEIEAEEIFFPEEDEFEIDEEVELPPPAESGETEERAVEEGTVEAGDESEAEEIFFPEDDDEPDMDDEAELPPPVEDEEAEEGVAEAVRISMDQTVLNDLARQTVSAEEFGEVEMLPPLEMSEEATVSGGPAIETGLFSAEAEPEREETESSEEIFALADVIPSLPSSDDLELKEEEILSALRGETPVPTDNQAEEAAEASEALSPDEEIATEIVPEWPDDDVFSDALSAFGDDALAVVSPDDFPNIVFDEGAVTVMMVDEDGPETVLGLEEAGEKTASAETESSAEATLPEEESRETPTEQTESATEEASAPTSEAVVAEEPPAREASAEQLAAAPATEEAAEESVHIGDVELPAALFALFVGEAQQHLDVLHRDLPQLRDNPTSLLSETTARAAHTLAGISGTARIAPLQSLAHSLEYAMHRQQALKAPPTAETLDLFALAANTLDAMLADVCAYRMPLPSPEMLTMLDSSLLPPAKNASAPDEVEVSPAPAEAGPEAPVINDEVDESLLPVFLEESTDLLGQMRATLRIWKAAPDEDEHAKALARLLHTLKGSARMTGAMKLGDFFHQLETRFLTAQRNAMPVETTVDETDLALDQAEAMINALTAKEPVEQEVVETAVETVVPAPRSKKKKTAMQKPSQIAPAPERETAAANVRVRADALDTFVNEAGEIGIARTRIEGELRTLRHSLLDLTENVIRLRNQLREVEIQAEVQMQSRIALAEALHGEDFDPLEMDRYTRLQELTRMMAESVNDVTTVQQSLLRNLDGADIALHAQARLSRELQQGLMRIRMVPFDSLADRLYRVVRQSSKEVGKRANLDIIGGTVEIDRGVLEHMATSFEHILRNAVAHGIESPEERLAAGKPEAGRVNITVTQEGNELVIDIEDDGRGLDFEGIIQKAREKGLLKPDETPDERHLADFIFNSGFTTANKLSAVSGRGVGMDVVRAETASAGGRVQVQSRAGEGTLFRIYLPLTLAVTQALLVRAANHSYAIPSSLVAQVTELKRDAFVKARQEHHVEWMGEEYAYHYLPRLLGDRTAQPEEQRYNWVILLRSGDQRLAVHVDSLRSNQEIVIKTAGPQLSRLIGMSGATVMPDGEIVLIINPIALLSRLPQGFGEDASAAEKTQQAESEPLRQALVMIVDDSLTVRKITGRMLEREGYRVVTAKDGIDALEQLTEFTPDVILSDIEMPRMDGFDFLRSLRADERTQAIPVIMITSRLADKHRQYAMELGANHYLGKPFNEDELFALLNGYTANLRH